MGVVRIKKPNNGNNGMWQSLATYGFSSLNIGITALGGYFIGGFLEKSYHFGNMAVIGAFIGLILGLIELFIIVFKAGTKK